MKILGDSQILLFDELFSSLGETATYSGRELSEGQLIGVDALITRSTLNVDQALLANTDVKFVGTCTIGIDHLDTAFLDQQNITWANAPACNANAVVQYVLSAMAQLSPRWMSATVGIIGCGNVGGRVYRRLTALGVNCQVYDPFLSARSSSEDSLDSSSLKLVSLEELLQSDIITSHAPLTTTGDFPSYHLLGEKELEQLRPNTLLISAGRGAVINNQALIKRLTDKKDIRVALDVWENEPDISAELLSLVDIATPHIAGHSLEGKEQGTVMVFEQLCQHLGVASPVSVMDIVNTETSALPVLSNSHLSNKSDLAPEDMLNQVLLSAYPIMQDDARLRAWSQSGQSMTTYFDRMRKNYPIRREYSHFIFPEDAQQLPVSNWLNILCSRT